MCLKSVNDLRFKGRFTYVSKLQCHVCQCHGFNFNPVSNFDSIKSAVFRIFRFMDHNRKTVEISLSSQFEWVTVMLVTTLC